MKEKVLTKCFEKNDLSQGGDRGSTQGGPLARARETASRGSGFPLAKSKAI